MAKLVKLYSVLIIASSICHYAHGTYATPDACHVAVAELRQQIQQVLERQQLYEIKLSNQQKTIDEQEFEISTLRDIIVRRLITVDDVNIHEENSKERKNESLIWDEEEKLDAKNYLTRKSRKVLYGNERKPLSQSNKHSTIRRSVIRRKSENFYNSTTSKELQKRQDMSSWRQHRQRKATGCTLI